MMMCGYLRVRLSVSLSEWMIECDFEFDCDSLD